jgi:TRAP-type C4-dicarboxylate transport system substrate-binding protein
MKIKRNGKLLTTLVVIAGLIGYFAMSPPPAASAESFKTKWKMDSPYPLTEGDHLRGNWKLFCDLIKERTGGRLTIEPYFGGALGYKGTEALDVIKKGLVEIEEVTNAWIIGTVPGVELFSLPFFMRSFDEVTWLQAAFKPYLESVYERYNGKLLVPGLWPPQHFFAKKPIKTIKDFKGLKARGLGPTANAAFKALGMFPIPLTWGDVMPSLERGMINTMTSSALSTSQAAGWEALKYTIRTDYCAYPADLVVNKDAWNKLPADIKIIMLDTAREIETKVRLGAKASDEKMIAFLESKGMKTITLSPEVRKEAAELVKGAWDAPLKKASPEALKALDDFLSAVGRTR